MLHAGKSIVSAGLLGVVTATSLIASHTVAAADGIKAAYVETVIPSKAYSGQGVIGYVTNAATMGPSQTGVLGLGNIVLTNFASQIATVIVAGVDLDYGVCGASNATVISYTAQPIYLILPAQSTLVVPFPTPYVINPAGGQACILVQYTSSNPSEEIQVTVTGLVN